MLPLSQLPHPALPTLSKEPAGSWPIPCCLPKSTAPASVCLPLRWAAHSVKNHLPQQLPKCCHCSRPNKTCSGPQRPISVKAYAHERTLPAVLFSPSSVNPPSHASHTSPGGNCSGQGCQQLLRRQSCPTSLGPLFT